MPVKSKSQWRKIWAMVERGEMTKEKAREMTAGQNYKNLPESAPKKKKKRKKK